MDENSDTMVNRLNRLTANGRQMTGTSWRLHGLITSAYLAWRGLYYSFKRPDADENIDTVMHGISPILRHSSYGDAVQAERPCSYTGLKNPSRNERGLVPPPLTLPEFEYTRLKCASRRVHRSGLTSSRSIPFSRSVRQESQR